MSGYSCKGKGYSGKGTFCTGTAVTLVFQDKVDLWLSLYTIRAFSRSLNNFAGMSFTQTTN